MRKFKVVVIDDERDARELLKIYLKEHPQLEVIGEAKNGSEAIAVIKELSPAIIFLDIDMPDKSGIEVLGALEVCPHTIFVTAYDEYAINAFELNAVDYLLKPINPTRLSQAIKKAELQLSTEQDQSSLYESLLQEIAARQSSHQFLQKLTYREHTKTSFIDVKKIVAIESADQYVWVRTSEEKFLIRQSMDYLETRLDPDQFFRSHRTAIINLDEVKTLEQYEPRNLLVHLSYGITVKLSQSRKALFQSKMGL